jgi:hypothetical protein
MIKRTTWVMLALLALVVGAYFGIKSLSSKGIPLTATPTGYIFLITGSDGVLQSLRISDNKGGTFQMQRDMSMTWVITAPMTGAADQGLSGAAETQVGALRIVTVLDAHPELSDLGLDIPAHTMEIGFLSGAGHKIEIGNKSPTNSGYYVRFDGEKIYIIEQSGIDALLNLLTGPPYIATDTPSPPTEPTSTMTPGFASPKP